jgi:hypothetical protein
MLGISCCDNNTKQSFVRLNRSYVLVGWLLVTSCIQNPTAVKHGRLSRRVRTAPAMIPFEQIDPTGSVTVGRSIGGRQGTPT